MQKQNSYVDKIVALFRKKVTENYELEDEVIISLSEIVRKSVDAVSPPTARRTRSKPKQRRKKSAYNMFVRVMMQDEDIKSLGHKNKMSAIGSKWTSLVDEDKEQYKSMADDENKRDEEHVEEEEEEAKEAEMDTVTEEEETEVED